jgi:hypothetical protein
MAREAYKYVMNKYAGFASDIAAAKDLLTVGGMAATAVMAGKSIVNKLNNDTRRKALIEDLARNDSILRQVPKDKLIAWYGVIYQYGPQTSLNKEVTKDLLHTFARFGRVDMPTLKTLAETEKAMAGTNAWSPSSTFGSFLH